MTTAAPGRLEVVRGFVNTRDIDLGTDTLSSPAGLSAWLREVGLGGSSMRASAGDVRRAAALREALREALQANHSRGRLPRTCVTILNATAQRGRLSLQIDADGGWAPRVGAGHVDGALGEIVAIVARAMADGSWNRLKACVNDACRWAFYDESRARSGKWCSMQICGNRAKQQTWRARNSAGPPAYRDPGAR